MRFVYHKIKNYDVCLAALKTVDRSGSNEIEIVLVSTTRILVTNQLIDAGNMWPIGRNNQDGSVFGRLCFGMDF